METIRGRTSLDMVLKELNDRIAGYDRIALDLGTGDGRYVHSLAERNPSWFVIGVDCCRENLQEHSRAKLPNMLFIIASAQALPAELNGLVSHVTINFPWGSLLESLLAGDKRLMRGLEAISCSVTSIDVRLNSGALSEIGSTLDAGVDRIYRNMILAGWLVDDPVSMDAHALSSLPTTWARRLAYGRDPRALEMSGWFASQPKTIERQVVFNR